MRNEGFAREGLEGVDCSWGGPVRSRGGTEGGC